MTKQEIKKLAQELVWDAIDSLTYHSDDWCFEGRELTEEEQHQVLMHLEGMRMKVRK